MLRMLYGGLLAQLLSVAAELRLADLVTDEPVPVERLAERTATQPQALHRVLRALAANGVFTETAPGQFARTPLSDTLRGDGSESLRELALLVGAPQTHATFAELRYSVRTGQPAFDLVHGMDWWSYLEKDPGLAAVFHGAMGGAARAARAAAVTGLDLTLHRRLVDLGGGHGYLVAELLQRHPALRAVVFDRPEVVTGAAPVLTAAGVADRAEVVGGDFFDAVPRGGDAYLLSWILHDWNDEQAVAILRSVRAAVTPDGRVYILDTVIPPGDQPHPGKLLDIVMLAQHTGRERTAEEFVALLARSGWRYVTSRTLADAPTGVVIAAPA
jgi:predicted O-methyltransferase YrrM/predicted transcriptional regulator